jgi:hypothetical protein
MKLRSRICVGYIERENKDGDNIRIDLAQDRDK